MSEKINKLYKPAELEAAIEVLTNNTYRNFDWNDAAEIVKALHLKGFRIVKCPH